MTCWISEVMSTSWPFILLHALWDSARRTTVDKCQVQVSQQLEEVGDDVPPQSSLLVEVGGEGLQPGGVYLGDVPHVDILGEKVIHMVRRRTRTLLWLIST